MAVTVLKQEYFNQFKPSSTTNWLLGNVGDWQRLVLDLEFAVRINFSISDPLTVTNPNILTLSGRDWGDEGFATGQFCTLEFLAEDLTNNNLYPNTRTFTIGNITGSDMEVLNMTGGANGGWNYPQATMPYTDSVWNIRNVVIYVDARPEGIHLTYGQIANSQSISGTLASIIDGTLTSFQTKDEDPLTPGSPMPIGIPKPFDYILNPYQSGLSVEAITIEYLGSQNIAYNYRVEIIFMITAFYDDINNFINNIAPDAVKGSESLTDGFQIIGYPIYNNPNVTIKNDPKRTQQEGNTGWFNENFNQLPNPFTFTPVVYTNLSGTVVSQLDYVNPIVMTTTISGIQNLTGATSFQYGFGWATIDEDNYKETIYPAHKNYKISTGGQAAALTDSFTLSPVTYSPFPSLRLGYSQDGISGMDVSDIKFVQNGTDVDVSLTFRPSTAFAAYMDTLSEDERQYFIWVSVGDQAPAVNLSDRVSLLLDFNKMNTYVEPIGPWDGMTIDFLDHPQAYNDTPIACGNSIYVEDDLLAKVAFLVDTAVDPLTIPVPSKITFGVLVEQDITGTQYILDKREVDLSVYPDPTQYNFDQLRDFKLGVGNSKNWFKVKYNAPADVGTEKGVLGWYGFKTRWEDWIKRFPVAPNDFYDNTLLNNGLNNDWYHYYAVNGWKLYFYVNTTTQLGTYQNLKQMTVLDYDSNGTITTTIDYYRDNAGVKGALLTGGVDPVYGGQLGVIIANEFVWLDITYTSSVVVPDWTSQVTVDASVYATQCIEVDNGAGQKEFRQLSSIWVSEFDNPMVGIVGETLSKVVWVSNTEIRVETRIEANKLIDSPRYKITGREGCK